MSNITLQFPLEELTRALGPTIENAMHKAMHNFTSTPSSLKEFLTENEAREFLGGISRSLFHKLKKADKFNTYHCGEGRCLYLREELISYVKNNKPAAK